ncbi:hypothetical protein BGZ46_006636, partial [Entomortierella lignicola]
VQLTVLAVVSCNDYGKNIYSLGLATNFSIVKTIGDEVAQDAVRTYLHHGQVILKNSDDTTFDAALRVFVDYKQTPISSPELSTIGPSHGEIYSRFKALCTLYQTKQNVKRFSAQQR